MTSSHVPHAARRLAAAALVLGAACAVAGGESPALPGESTYRLGQLDSGRRLEGARDSGGAPVVGADAACVNCHQRSGLGATEGRTTIPPITGMYLFHPRDKRTGEYALPFVPGARENREPYTDETLARAIRDGLDANGKPLSYLMPRFSIGDADMAALIAYLKSLDVRRVPGVTDSALHFATVFTPDVDPARRRAVLDVVETYFADKNRFQFGPSAKLQPSGKTMYAKSMFMVNRRWQLHVWDLTGPASSWQAQLTERLAAEPVLAVVSGLAGPHWEPVHDFCERESLPCLFPNVEVPVVGSDDFYTLYLSGGVTLEAAMIAARLQEASDDPALRVVHQVYRVGDSGEAGAKTLAAALEPRGIAVRNHVVAADAAPGELARALQATSKAQALVLWLRPSDLSALGPAPPSGARVYASGLMGGLEVAPLPEGWRDRTWLTYPVDLPDKRIVRVDYALGWFALRHVPVVDARIQVDTYLACGLLAETLSHMVDTFVRPYLIEQLQTSIDHRILTGYYPHLSLASHQQFASKGGFFVRLAGANGSKLVAESGWTVP